MEEPNDYDYDAYYAAQELVETPLPTPPDSLSRSSSIN